MPTSRPFAATAGLMLFASIATAAAPSPLLIPAEADYVLQVHQPRRLVGLTQSLDAFKAVQGLAAVREQLNATTPRRLRQLLAHFEKRLGAKYPELLDDVLGGGFALGGKFGNNAPAVLVVQGTDEKRVERFLAEGLEVLASELKRQEAKQSIAKGSSEGIVGYKVGDILLARVGSALVLSNNKDAMAKALRLASGKDTKSLADHPGVLAAAKLAPKDALAGAWFNMKPVHDSPAGKALYASPRDDVIQTAFFGGYLDVLGRAPFVCASLTADKDDLTLTVQAPAGRDGAGPDAGLHMGPAEPLAPPLLEPKNVLYSTSFCLDLARAWQDRAKLFPAASVKGLDDTNETKALAFGGVRLEKVLAATAPYHRFVATSAPTLPYKREPTTRLPAFAVVVGLKEPERFGGAAGTALRLLALALTGTYKMAIADVEHAGHNVASYRFDEKADVPQDAEGLRYNFTPSFVRVGDQFIVASRLELAKELVDLIAAEQKATKQRRAESVRDRFYASGLAALMRDSEDQLVTQAILDTAASPEEAKRQVAEAVRFVGSLGSLTLSTTYGPKVTRYEVTARLRPEGKE